MHACNKVFHFSSFLHLVLLLSWKGGERADSLRIIYMNQRQHGKQDERMVLPRDANSQGRQVRFT